MPETTPDRIEEIESLARHNCDELAGLIVEIAELQARVEALEGRRAEAPPCPNCPRCEGIGAISREGGTDGDHA
ncbi:hypothetical protein [Rhodovulum kholense]|uniref:Uncharacterized protein n=1 Tax=Rhodovulum kholense TaxID=453584 RepID=A0A8E3APJ1_9RHOB|nr:hypothetical protein [Rhodovulum kholense]PTW46062.1 hypothetical protein C8N38_11218 [Rhodovulum kholense]